MLFCMVLRVLLCWCRLVLVKWNVCGLILVRNVFSDIGSGVLVLVGSVGREGFISIG